MKKDLGNVGELFPQSVFVVGAYGEDGAPNAMNVAWGGACARREVGSLFVSAYMIYSGATTARSA